MIRTERLLLRRWRAADRAPFAIMNADPEVVQHLQGPLSRQRSDAFVDRIEAHWEEQRWGLWAVEVPGEVSFMGYVGLWPAEHVAPGMVEVGWRLARPYWGLGYATEAAREALRYGFIDVGLEEIVSFTVPQHVRSRAVMQRIGLIREPSADFDHPNVDPVVHPHLVRHVMYRLRREAWLENSGCSR